MNDTRSYNLSFLQRISDNDESFIIDMIKTFKSNVKNFLDKTDKYFEENDFTGISNETHRFIPGTSFLGAKDLEALLIKISIMN